MARCHAWVVGAFGLVVHAWWRTVSGYGLEFASCGLETVVQPDEWFTCTSAYQMVNVTAAYLRTMFFAVAKPFWTSCEAFKVGSPDLTPCVRTQPVNA